MKKFIGPNGEHMTSAHLNELSEISDERLAEIVAMSDEDIDFSDIPPLNDEFWENAVVNWPENPETKVHLTMRLDKEVVDFFKRRGRGYQSRINAVLRAYVNARMREEAKAEGQREAQAKKSKAT